MLRFVGQKRDQSVTGPTSARPRFHEDDWRSFPFDGIPFARIERVRPREAGAAPMRFVAHGGERHGDAVSRPREFSECPSTRPLLHRDFARLPVDDERAILDFASRYGKLSQRVVLQEPFAAWTFHITRMRFLVNVADEIKANRVADERSQIASLERIAGWARATVRCLPPPELKHRCRGFFDARHVATAARLATPKKDAWPERTQEEFEEEWAEWIAWTVRESRAGLTPPRGGGTGDSGHVEDEWMTRPGRPRAPAKLHDVYEYWPEFDVAGDRLCDDGEEGFAPRDGYYEPWELGDDVEMFLDNAVNFILREESNTRVSTLTGIAVFWPKSLLSEMYALLVADLSGAGIKSPRACRGCGRYFYPERPNQHHCKGESGMTARCRKRASRA